MSPVSGSRDSSQPGTSRESAHANNHVLSNHKGSRRAKILLLYVGDLFPPALLAGSGFERYKITIRRLEKQPVVIHAKTAVADVDSTLGSPKVMPDLLAGSRIHGPGM